MAAAVHFTSPELARWDALALDGAAVAFFEDERPLRGAAGLVDWRLCGRVSRWLSAGRVSGAPGETLLTTPGRKLPFPKIFLYGLGPSERFDEPRYKQALAAMRDAMWMMGARKWMLSLPGRDVGLIAPRRALELMLEEAAASSRIDEVTICDTAAAQKEMAEALRTRQRSQR